jgi:hypothetical protein
MAAEVDKGGGVKQSTNRTRLIEQAMRNLQTKAFLANGGKISVEPIRPATKHNPLALSINRAGKPRNARSG